MPSGEGHVKFQGKKEEEDIVLSSFTELQISAQMWRARNFPVDPEDREKHLLQQVLGVCEESGELAHAVLKMSQGIRGSEEEHRKAAMDAVGDIVIYLTGVCDDLGVSFHECVTQAWHEVMNRDWVNNKEDGSHA